MHPELQKKDFSLPLPSGRPDLLIIAGEHSGDAHAARMARELLSSGKMKNICALGGHQLQGAGANLLMDMTAFSVVGFVEVVKNYAAFARLFAATIKWIEQARPRAVCFVDYPGFNLRLAKELLKRGLSQKGGDDVALYYYISPQIWAWKARRRFAMATTLDALGVIFPFEIECYKDTDLPVTFVGHPFAEADFSNPVRYDAQGDILLLPGSRPQAVGRIFPRLLNGFSQWHKNNPQAKASVLYPSEFILEKLKQIAAQFPQLDGALTFVDARGAQNIPARAVLMSSGTMSLCCCLAGIPGAIVYHAHPLTYALGRMIVSIRYLGIANLLLNRPAWPEYLQGDSAAPKLAQALDDALTPERVTQARDDAATLRHMLGHEDGTPTPARWLENLMAADQ